MARMRRSRSALAKKRAAIIKQAQVLSSVCDVDVGIVTYSKSEDHFTSWPNHSTVKNMLEMFSRMSTTTHVRNIVSHRDYLMQAIEKENNKKEKTREENDKAELQEVMNVIFEGSGIDEIDHNQLTKLLSFTDEKIKEIEIKEQFGKSKDIVGSSSGSKTEDWGPEDVNLYPKDLKLFNLRINPHE